MTALLEVKNLQRHFSVEGKKEWLAGKKSCALLMALR